MSDGPDDAELQGLLQRLVELGASEDELEAAQRTGQLSDLALDVALRPPGETVPLDRFIENSGLDEDVVRRLWSAVGLPSSGPVHVTPDAADAIRFFSAMAGLFESETAFAFTRVLGSSASRLAEALISAFRVDVELPGVTSGTGFAKRTEEMMDVVQQVLPLLLDAVNAVFRRHMVRVSYQLWMPDDQRAAVTHERTVGFADIVGSTETVRAASPAALAIAVRQFEERVWELVTDAGGRVVKLIGDEAMFVVESPAAACTLAREACQAGKRPTSSAVARPSPAVKASTRPSAETSRCSGRCVTKGKPSSSVEMSEANGWSRISSAAIAGSSHWKCGGRYMRGYSHSIVAGGLLLTS